MNSPNHTANQDNLSIALDSIYCLHRLGDHVAAEQLNSEIQHQLITSPLHKTLAQLILLIGKYEQNKLASTDYAELANVLKKPIEESGLDLYQGWLYFLQGFYLKKEDLLLKAVEAFKKGFYLNEVYEVYYWLSTFRLLPAEEKYSIFLRTYPIKSIYSRIMGNLFFQDLFKDEIFPKTQIQKDQAKNWLIEHYEEDEEEENDQFNCWLVSNNSISPAFYKDIDLGDNSYLDLYSGLINDRGEFAFLMLSELNCLSFLISSQLIGATLGNLAEFLQKSESDSELVIDAVKKLGIKIKKENGLYFLHWESKPKLIIPRTLKVVGLQEYVRKKHPQFTKTQLMELLQLTQFGAESLMKKWALAGFIRPMENQSIWKFL